MKPTLILLYLLLISATCTAQAEDEVVFIGGKSFVLKRAGLNETFSFQTAHETVLFRLYPYYGTDKNGLVIYFAKSRKYGFLEGNNSETVVTNLLSDVRKNALIRDTVIDEAKEKQFLRRHPLPKGYRPPQDVFDYQVTPH